MLYIMCKMYRIVVLFFLLCLIFLIQPHNTTHYIGPLYWTIRCQAQTLGQYRRLYSIGQKLIENYSGKSINYGSIDLLYHPEQLPKKIYFSLLNCVFLTFHPPHEKNVFSELILIKKKTDRLTLI